MYDIPSFLREQLSAWPMAEANFAALDSTVQRVLKVGGLDARVQFNPCRIASSTARTDKATLDSRPCFLCVEHRQKEQFHLPFNARSGRMWRIQVNPFPIFPGHLVIASDTHRPQTILPYFDDMLEFAEQYRSYTVYYNGPMSGASAPDHLHFQGCPRHILPLEEAVESWLDGAAPDGSCLASAGGASLHLYPGFTRGVYCIRGGASADVSRLFGQFLHAATDWRSDEPEPRINLFSWHNGSEYRVMAVMRTELRSRHYYSDGSDHLTISPGAAEMAGVFVAPVHEDYLKVTAEQLEEMLSDVSIDAAAEARIAWRLSRTQDLIEVGIMSAPELRFEIIGDGRGPRTATARNGRVLCDGEEYPALQFGVPFGPVPFAEAAFILYGVTIGIDFHWQRSRDLRYSGALKIVADGDNVMAVNIIGIEDYLLSVISSEMKSSASPDLLMAHAVISRSWCQARILERRAASGDPAKTARLPHALFDVCADDHCQRYQGSGMAVGDKVRAAIDETWGQVLMYGGELCDARYSKCCGGTTELFSTCWEDVDPPYLQSFADVAEERGTEGVGKDVAEGVPKSGAHGSGLKSSPCRGTEGVGKDVAEGVEDAFCDCEDSNVLAQVLNDYDLETRDFFRWQQRYTVAELSELVCRRTGIDFGRIKALEPLETGPSGRIKRLRIVGTERTDVIGKELAIRRALSESHLKSSAFEVRLEDGTFILDGLGWGHGVGLCQIGAAVMAEKGYNYIEILKHYYKGATIEQNSVALDTHALPR